ncbi:hypothetical protein TWF718_007737 [Orbilia javanica]|uniref:Uncharacterized protein n=1 Tax=Orbilia javanica TaxID=47235 RepID=A0AAN8MM43_9PEZI
MARPHFLGLPFELRLEIYSHVFPAPPRSPSYSPTSPVFSPTSPAVSPGPVQSFTPTYPLPSSVNPPPSLPDPVNLNVTVPVIAAPVPPARASTSTSSATSALATNWIAPVEPVIPISPIHYSFPSPTYSPRSPCYDSLPIDPKVRENKFSILYVNKQIHSEVKELLYRRNTVKISIILDASLLEENTKAAYKVVYHSPWEDLEYTHIVDLAANTREKYYTASYEVYKDHESVILSREEYLGLQQPGVIIAPRPEYRPYIRRVHITIDDNRYINNAYQKKNLGDLSEMTRSDSRFLLLPFLWRLREVLSHSTKVDLSIYPSEGRYWDYIDDSDGQAWHGHYERTLETVFLLTRGPWKHKLELITALGWKFPGLEEGVKSRCEADPEYQEAALQEAFRDLKVGIPEDSWWGYHNRKLTVFDPNFRHHYVPSPPFSPGEIVYTGVHHPYCTCPRSPGTGPVVGDV